MPPTTTPAQKIQLPNIFICGPSGSGKSSCFRNLDPEKTAIININRKALPFKDALKFKYNKMVASHADVTTELLLGFGMKPAIEVIAIDDFTSVDESILQYCRQTKSGWDIFATHNQMVREILNTSKILTETRNDLPPKWVVFLGLDDLVNIALPDGGNKTVRRVKVAGKELEGTIEKEFTIVLFTEVRATVPGARPQHMLLTNADGVCSAKTPMGLFNDMYIDNDLKKIIDSLKAYYGLPQ